jgi:uncharacterized protein YggT (Ycf19 family)
MTSPDGIRRPDARKRPTPNRTQQKYDEFHETLAASATPVPNRTYRSEIDLTNDHPSVAEQIVRFVAVVLEGLLAIRFITNLFSADRTNGFVNFFNTATDWLVQPFQALLGQSPLGTAGFVDWPAIAALIVVGAIAWIIIRLMRPHV